MDLFYAIAMGLLGLAIWAFAQGCARLQAGEGQP